MLQKAVPHLVAALVFLIVAILYCRPALEGKVLSQSDITQWEGANRQSVEYKEAHGHYPLWTNSMFSGMPTFLIAYDSNNVVPWIVHNVLTLGLPKPIQFFFLACICFYFLAVVLRVNPYIGILGALAFAYATYNPVIISVGHDTKMWSIAYMPALMASVLLVYEKKYLIGGALTALFTAVMVAMNHPQIVYYLLLSLGIMTLFFVVRWMRAKEYKHLGMAAGITIAGGLIGVATNAANLMAVYEYQKETIRSGGSALASDSTATQQSKTGLSKDYAFSYSLKIAEPLVMFSPQLFGGSDGPKEMDPEVSKAVEVLRTFPREWQQAVPFGYYWGGLGETGIGTSGPPYLGATICFLAILGMFVLDNKHKWWILATSVLVIIMSWGSYFDDFNTLLYKYLPFYDKFRAPSMILVVPQLLFPIMAVLTLQRVTEVTDQQQFLKLFKKGLIATAVLFGVMLMVYLSADFTTSMDRQFMSQVSSMNQSQVSQMMSQYMNALKEDRASLMMGSIRRSFVFVLLAAALVFFLYRKKISYKVALVALTILCFADLMMVNVRYLSADNYHEPEEMRAFVATPADQQILQDTGYYRVFNADPNRFQETTTSYFHNSLGGYHAAKLKIYQDLIERQLSGNVNFAVLNMLNAKYILQTNPQTRQKMVQQNPSALGPCWLVKGIQFVPDAQAEMAALNGFSPADTAIVQQAFQPSIPFTPQWDSTATIQLVKNDNDIIQYSFAANSNQFAVFSEIYYAAGWKAFIDGKEAPIVKVNYVLRGLAVPAGNHQIEFRFEPQGYYTGRKITSIATILLGLSFLPGIFAAWKKRKSPAARA